MAKLTLREACFNGLENVQTCKIQNKPEHDNLIKESNRRIEENRIRYAVAYKNADSYLGQ